MRKEIVKSFVKMEYLFVPFGYILDSIRVYYSTYRIPYIILKEYNNKSSAYALTKRYNADI